MKKIIGRWTSSVSKQLAFMIFVAGCIFSYIEPGNASTILPASWLASSALVATKTGAEAYSKGGQ